MSSEKFAQEFVTVSNLVNENRMEDLLNASVQGDKEYNHLPVVCMEELAELIQAIAKSLRRGSDARMNLIEEMADATIAIRYLYLLFDIDPGETARAVNVKLDRLERKLKEKGHYE